MIYEQGSIAITESYDLYTIVNDANMLLARGFRPLGPVQAVAHNDEQAYGTQTQFVMTFMLEAPDGD